MKVAGSNPVSRSGCQVPSLSGSNLNAHGEMPAGCTRVRQADLDPAARASGHREALRPGARVSGEMADAHGSGPCAARHEGSTPSSRTKRPLSTVAAGGKRCRDHAPQGTRVMPGRTVITFGSQSPGYRHDMPVTTFGLPAWAAFIFWLLVVVILVILAALVVHALGGFMWQMRMGHFRFLIGVT